MLDSLSAYFDSLPALYETFLRTVEFSQLGDLARRSVWLYPAANTLHVLGAAFLVGAILVYDIRILRGREPTRTALTLSIIGLVLLLVTGPTMFSAEATAIGHNPIFQLKMAVILAALINVLLHWLAGPVMPRIARLHAVLSALLWTGALILGRLIAYF
jgi:hypothetical protein